MIMKKNLKKIGLLTFLSALLIFTFLYTHNVYAASVYYVDGSSNAASDTNSGTESSPWKTLQKAASTLKAGDKVIVKAAIYRGDVVPANSGTASAYIIYEAREGAIIDGAGIKINQKQYIEVNGFKVQNTSGEGIIVTGPNSKFINLKNNYTWNTGGSGIAVWGRAWGNDPAECNYECVTDILIEGNRIERANNVKMNGGYNEHLTIASGVKRITIRKNTLTAGPMPSVGFEAINGGEGIDLKEGVADAWVYENDIHDMVNCRYGIYIDAGGSTWGYPGTYKTVPGWMRNIHVYNNKVYQNDGHGIGVVSEGSGNMDGVYIYNNVVYKNGNDGILVYDWGLTGRPNPPSPLPAARNIYVFNNTVYKNAQIRNWYGGIAIDHKFATSIFIRNNLTFGNPTNIRRYNVPTGTVIDTNIETSGLVKNADSGDFSLNAGSTAIDTGSNNLPFNLTFDFNNIARPFNSRLDVGALEYVYIAAPVIIPTSNQGTTETKYLSDMDPISTINGWGPYEKNMSNGEDVAGDGRPITLNGVTYQKGLGTHALSELTYSISPTCTNFMASIGVDEEVDVRGSVVFQVFGNGTKIFDSGFMTNLSDTQNINVPLSNITTLQLVVQNGGDDFGSDHASWADARIVCTQPPVVVETVSSNPVTINKVGLSSNTATPGQNISLTYNWRGGPTDKAYTAFIHFVNSSGRLVFQDDHTPSTSSTLWNNNSTSYNRSITLPANLPFDTYKIMAGLYDPVTGVRQTLTQGSGVSADTTEGQRYQIGTLTVSAPVSTPTPSSSTNTSGGAGGGSTQTSTNPGTPTTGTPTTNTNTGGAGSSGGSTSGTGTVQTNVLSIGPWVGQYYTWTSVGDYFKKFELMRLDREINFDWGTSSPTTNMTSDKFAVRWMGIIDLPTNGNYNFTAEVDGGLKVWVDNALILNEWRDQFKTHKFSSNLTSGKHLIQVEYFENTGTAKANLYWTLGTGTNTTTKVRLTKVLAKGNPTYSADVATLQQYLYENGYLDSEPTGFFRNQTEAAVIKLQKAYGLEPVGTVGPLTRKIINGD